MGCIQRRFDVIGVGAGAFANDFAGDGRHILEILPGLRFDECAIDEVAIARLEREFHIQMRCIKRRAAADRCIDIHDFPPKKCCVPPRSCRTSCSWVCLFLTAHKLYLFQIRTDPHARL